MALTRSTAKGRQHMPACTNTSHQCPASQDRSATDTSRRCWSVVATARSELQPVRRPQRCMRSVCGNARLSAPRLLEHRVCSTTTPCCSYECAHPRTEEAKSVKTYLGIQSAGSFSESPLPCCSMRSGGARVNSRTGIAVTGLPHHAASPWRRPLEPSSPSRRTMAASPERGNRRDRAPPQDAEFRAGHGAAHVGQVHPRRVSRTIVEFHKQV